MATIVCGLLVTLDISQLDPGSDESWLAGDPSINWDDGTTSSDVIGATINHIYTNVGRYTIVLSGTNTCNEFCTHSEDIILITNPANLRITDVQANNATAAWENVPGSNGYTWELFQGETLIDNGETTDTNITLYGLDINTEYAIYVFTIVDTLCSRDFCDACFADFTTLHDTCELPICGFVTS